MISIYKILYEDLSSNILADCMTFNLRCIVIKGVDISVGIFLWQWLMILPVSAAITPFLSYKASNAGLFQLFMMQYRHVVRPSATFINTANMLLLSTTTAAAAAATTATAAAATTTTTTTTTTTSTTTTSTTLLILLLVLLLLLLLLLILLLPLPLLLLLLLPQLLLLFIFYYLFYYSCYCHCVFSINVL